MISRSFSLSPNDWMDLLASLDAVPSRRTFERAIELQCQESDEDPADRLRNMLELALDIPDIELSVRRLFSIFAAPLIYRAELDAQHEAFDISQALALEDWMSAINRTLEAAGSDDATLTYSENAGLMTAEIKGGLAEEMTGDEPLQFLRLTLESTPFEIFDRVDQYAIEGMRKSTVEKSFARLLKNRLATLTTVEAAEVFKSQLRELDIPAPMLPAALSRFGHICKMLGSDISIDGILALIQAPAAVPNDTIKTIVPNDTNINSNN